MPVHRDQLFLETFVAARCPQLVSLRLLELLSLVLPRVFPLRLLRRRASTLCSLRWALLKSGRLMQRQIISSREPTRPYNPQVLAY